MFKQKKLPKHIVLVGAGYIAIEFACILHNLGVKVTLIYRGNSILRHFDSVVQKYFLKTMKDICEDVLLKTDVVKIEKKGKLFIHCTPHKTIACDQILFATGRKPNLSCLGNVSAAKSKSDKIHVNKYFQTNVPSLYALGDIIDGPELTPVAIAEAKNFVSSLYEKKYRAINYILIPTCVFSHPNIASFGLTEEKAVLQYKKVDIYESSFVPLKYSLVKNFKERNHIKVLVNAKTDYVLGAHIIGEGAGEIMQVLNIAVQNNLKMKDLDKYIAIHPTTAEELLFLKKRKAV